MKISRAIPAAAATQLLRNVTFRLLSAVGYKVLEAETPNQAIEMAQDNSEPIDLVLTDVIMPVMGGFELSTQLKALQPEQMAKHVLATTRSTISSAPS